jgi:diguanylate cyclase (GGDEF)-like protein
MTLRARLSLVLGVLVLVPLVAGAVLVGVAVPRAAADRVDDSLTSAVTGTSSAIAAACERSGSAVRALGRDLGTTTPRAAAEAVVSDRLAGWSAVLDADGRVLARAGDLPAGVDLADAGRCSDGRAVGAVVADRAQVDVRGREGSLTAVAGLVVDETTLDGWAADVGFDGLTLLEVADQVVVSTGSTDLAGMVSRSALPGPGQPFTVVAAVDQPSGSLVRQTVALVVLASVVVAVVLARWLADDMVRPIEEATRVAEQVAAGDLTRTIDVERGDEVGRLAVAFNRMTGELRGYVHALESSRDAMRTNLERLGQALSATHDLDTLLPVVLESALSSVGAGAGLVLLVDDDRTGASVRAEQSMAAAGLSVPSRVELGRGVLGVVAATGRTARGTLGQDWLAPTTEEPAEGQVLAVPLLLSPDVVGVIALYEPTTSEWFTDDDEKALQSLASQAAIAVENVVLHNEAQLASLTDPLTGLWNVRYLTMVINQEIERAARFDRSLSLLMLDLDHFKRVNDTYGHGRGDAVLVEFARRLRLQVREVDTVARYGGEEFVVVLPETSIEGAARLAERIGAAVRGVPFEVDQGLELEVTVSVGTSVFPVNGTTAPLLLRAADTALYAAKGAGRDRWASAAPVAGPV